MISGSLVVADLYSVNGLIAVVTGGATSMGLVMAKTLEANGAKVYILGRRKAALEEAAKQSTQGNLYPIECSVTSHDDLQRAVDYVSEREGHINLLVNNAGISTPNLEPHAQRPTPRWEVSRVREYWFNKSFEDYAKVFETNTTASLMTTFAFLELLDNGNKHSQSQAKACNGHGSSGKAEFVRSQVVGLGSVGAFGRDNSAFIYGASKAGTVQMMKNLGTYLIPWRIRVNAIAPGYFHTEMTDDLHKKTGGRLPASMVPEERFGRPEEIGGTLLYLASKAGGYCNGLVLLADGGYLGHHPSAY